MHRILIFGTGVILAVASVILFQYIYLVPVNTLLLAGFVYDLGISPMVIQYIRLVSKGLTYKEYVSRLSTARTYGIKDEKDLFPRL